MDTSTSAYRLLTLTALSGECSPDVLSYIGISHSYSEKLITKLKDENYIKTHYKEHLRGYRLTNNAKKLLIADNPERFSYYLSGNTDTNRPRSEYPRRLRLHHASIIYAQMLNSGICVFRDEKPLLFDNAMPSVQHLPLPVFYHSREVKGIGAEAVKFNNSRAIGILFAPKCIYTVFFTGENLMKWEYRTELKVKSMLAYHTSRGILSKEHISPCYQPDTPIKALIIGIGMDTALKLLTSTGGYHKSYFYLDGSFDYFHYIPVSVCETMLRLLCSPRLTNALRELLLSDMQPPRPDYGFEHDAISNGLPTLLSFDFDMLRLSRFKTALSFHSLNGVLICFDFQKDTLQQYFGDCVYIETIDLQKFERRFLH